MEKIVQILMKRDGMTKKDATAYVKDEMKYVRQCIEEGNFTEAEDYFGDVFGLEPDYLLAAIF